MSQTFDLSAVAAFGRATGDAARGSGANIGAIGASARVGSSRPSALQFDYMFLNYFGRSLDNHFLTASYVRQQTAGRARACFQAGGGVTVERVSFAGPGSSSTSVDAAALLGAGVTIDVRRRLTATPQVRVYGTAGPTLSIVGGVALGWRTGD